MKQIEKIKAKLLKEYAKKECKLDNPSQCKKSRCDCKIRAEVAALIKIVIPKGFRNFSIHDFDGCDKDNHILLETEVARIAKEQIMKYCWGKISNDDVIKLSPGDLLKRSIIDSRILNGKSIIIHGRSDRKIIRDEDNEISSIKSLPRGRTLIASIMTREAIRLRLKKHKHMISYDWIDFPQLFGGLKTNDQDAKDYVCCDWLVIDNIIERFLHTSENAKSFVASILDPFFLTRIQQGLPTILVFKFDVKEKNYLIEDAFGIGISKIVNDKDTLTISVSSTDGENGA